MEVKMFGIFSDAIDALLAFQDAVEEARTSDFFGLSTTSRGTGPSINLFQDGDSVVLMAELPGMKKEDIELKIKSDLFTISGERKSQYPEKASFHRIERKNYHFNRSVKLPMQVDADKSQAEYKNGVLKVIMPRAESDKPKMISIN